MKTFFTLYAVSYQIFMKFVHMLYNVRQTAVDVSTLTALSGDNLRIFVERPLNVCHIVVDVSTLSAMTVRLL